ncbi:MAG: hypothetical protein IKU82_01190, partial [Clostridia bacterium]|nr:hypothetical protein [Clostridia bacterium]
MDDISKTLADLLNDPDSLNRVREMAENILGNSTENAPRQESNNGSIFGDMDIDPAQIGKIMSVMSKLKSNRDDDRSRLLLALKPHLSPPRREKV